MLFKVLASALVVGLIAAAPIFAQQKTAEPQQKQGAASGNAPNNASAAHTFEKVDIQGGKEGITPVTTIDAKEQEEAPFEIERSFRDGLKQNVDQETMTRQHK